jgi:heavy metal translocating P-type ATPase
MQKTKSHKVTYQWQTVLFIASILAIVLNLALSFFHLSSIAGYSLHDIPLFIVIATGGLPLIFQILRKLFQGNFGADLLAALALITAVVLGEYLAAVLIILMLSSGQVLEDYAKRKASSVLLALSQRMPSNAHRKQGEKIEEILLSNVQINDVIVIYPHETATVDGVVIEGQSSMDESYLTGEPYRVSKAPGTKVLSGAINGESVLIVQAERLPADSRYASIMQVMQEAEQKRPTMRRLGDQIAIVFVPIAFIFALVTWFLTGDLTKFLSVLVVATPCPLLIAIPITIISAISMAAKRGIIIKDPTVLERLPTCRTAIFDKTGTLTYGQPELTEIIPAEGIKKEDVLQRTASIERYSKHPLASAIIQASQKLNLPLLQATSVSEKPGQGLTGKVENHTITITHRKSLLKINPKIETILPPISPGLECMVLEDDCYAATFHFRDAPRKEGKSFISHLKPSHQFQKIMLVSGDRESEVSYLAKLLDITEVLASQSPEQKLAIVQSETKKAPTLFMGDGINDAPALAVATVGIAFGQNSNITAEAAGAVIMDNSLIKVDELIHISKSMRQIALQSAGGGMILSIIGMGFAASGFITPVMGALLQEAIDILAIINALRMTLGGKVEIDLPLLKT